MQAFTVSNISLVKLSLCSCKLLRAQCLEIPHERHQTHANCCSNSLTVTSLWLSPLIFTNTQRKPCYQGDSLHRLLKTPKYSIRHRDTIKMVLPLSALEILWEKKNLKWQNLFSISHLHLTAEVLVKELFSVHSRMISQCKVSTQISNDNYPRRATATPSMSDELQHQNHQS